MANSINLDDEMSGLVDEGKATDVFCLDFNKAFNTVSYKILIDRLMSYGLDDQTSGL